MKKNILIVDDEVAMCEIIQKVISIFHFDSDTANNGKEGLELYRQNKYDLIITDMLMPIMNGKTMIEAIRKQEGKGEAIPILILSGYVSIHDVSELLEIGATYFLNKPIEMNDLIEYIHKALNIPFEENNE